MAKKSGLMNKLEHQYRAEFYAQRNMYAHISRQMYLDAALIAAHKVFGIGPKRAKLFAEEFIKAMNEIAERIVEDSKDDKDFVYTRAKIDELLKQICGENFASWEERYEKGYAEHLKGWF